jgi:hypothetical protein
MGKNLNYWFKEELWDSNFIPFSTKEELVNHIILTVDVKDKQLFYDICLRKINLIQDLIDNY